MKNSFISLCIISMALFVGCGKKSTKNEKKVVAANIVEQEIPLYQYEDDKFFDEDAIADFAFIDDEEEALYAPGDDGAKRVALNDDEWDDSLPLSWEDEEDGEFSFKTVNFDLNKNTIRDDQKVVVAENIKSAKEAVDSGKSIVVAGHCCPMGSASFNMSLSERRAKAIRDEMVKDGIPREKVKILGCGNENPIVLSDATDKVTRIKELSPNRRCEILVN